MNTINEALKQLEATEANLIKLDKIWIEIKSLIPDGIVFGDYTDGNYDDLCRSFEDILSEMPKIDGWTIPLCLYELNQIAQMRLDAKEIGEIECAVSVEESIFKTEKHLKAYRYRLDKKRRELVRNKVFETVDQIDGILRSLSACYPNDYEPLHDPIECKEWDQLKEFVAIIDTLLGSASRPPRWPDLQRHLHFHLVHDFFDIKNFDWPSVKSSLTKYLYTKSDPIPVAVKDLGELVAKKPSGNIITRLKWSSLADNDFERLVFCLISDSESYENPEWLTRTKAPDRGRDLSTIRVIKDTLGGIIRQRVIIQCKHWLSKSINIQDINLPREQMKLWEPPRVDVLIIATSGRFTTEAVEYVEKHNQSDSALRIEMWPESHLERLLASRPGIVAEFGLRQ